MIGVIMRTRCCVICETPYNIFNVIKHFWGKKDVYSIDLYISKNLKYLYDSLIEEKFFSAIYIFEKNVDENASNFQRILYSMFPNIAVKDAIKPQKSFFEYDEIYIFSATRFPCDMIYTNRNAKIKYIEDGMDSYIGRIAKKKVVGKKQKIYNWIVRRDMSRIYPQEVYVNVPKLCIKNLGYSVKKISNEQMHYNEIRDSLKRIYNYKESDLYRGDKIIYLGQAFVIDGMGEGIEKIEEEISKAFLEFEDQVVYRKHPRENNYSTNWKCVDKGDNMWELICQENIGENSVLISSFSTALFTPKLLFGKEPWLIYTHKLYKDYFIESNVMTEGLNEGINSMISNLKQSYKCPEKIICVSKIDELKEVIRKIKNGDERNV